jgi:hypothetical protein
MRGKSGLRRSKNTSHDLINTEGKNGNRRPRSSNLPVGGPKGAENVEEIGPKPRVNDRIKAGPDLTAKPRDYRKCQMTRIGNLDTIRHKPGMGGDHNDGIVLSCRLVQRRATADAPARRSGLTLARVGCNR